MRDVFAILAILAAVVGLGVFRVPDENALVAAGIRAAAEGAVYQERHPIAIAVDGRVVTASGRVESEAQRAAVLRRLSALDGVEAVEDGLTVLPTVQPFRLVLEKDGDAARASGSVPQAVLAPRLAAALGAEAFDLPAAAGAPDGDWGPVALAGARALALLLEGRMVLEDRRLSLTGVAHLPATRARIEAALAALPEAYRVTLRIETLDDGLPYSLHVSRDARMGLTVQGKLPPDFDPAAIAALGVPNRGVLAQAPLPLDAPGFADAVRGALPVAGRLSEMDLSVAPGLVSLSGGLASPEDSDAAKALRQALPEGYALHLALVPVDDGPALAARAVWDGSVLRFEGHVPQDFPDDRIAETFGTAPAPLILTRAPYPDLEDWDATVWRGLRALAALQRGEMRIDARGLRLSGWASDPLTRRRAAALAGPGSLEIALADDGTPPAFTLRYDATAGASVAGKLVSGLKPSALARALGVSEVRGVVPISPAGEAEPVLAVLEAVAPRLPLLEALTLHHVGGAFTLQLQAAADVDAPALRADLAARLPRGLDWHITRAAAPLQGTRRVQAATEEAQVFRDGLWLPAFDGAVTRESCAARARDLPQVPYDPGRFVPVALDAHRPLAALTALARACTRFVGVTLTIAAQAGTHDLQALNRQLARRRAEYLRDLLVARGVAPGAVRALGTAGEGNAIRYAWQ